MVPFADALEPDFEAFFEGFEQIVTVGFLLLIACVVVMLVRRYTSF